MMKNKLKKLMWNFGIEHRINFLRNCKSIRNYYNEGLSGQCPKELKRHIIKSYIKKYNVSFFIETGTHRGDTLDYVERYCSNVENLLSIELSNHYYEIAKERFKKSKKIKIHHGDSGDLLKDIIPTAHSGNILFWLDGHYSGGHTAKGVVETPIQNELSEILNSDNSNRFVILVDDVRCFNGTADYPELHELLRDITSNGRFNAEVSNDILRIVPKVLIG